MNTAWLAPQWQARTGVRACITTRQMPGVSQPPFEHCNLGSRCGDAPEAVAHNRALLATTLKLPSAPVWLHQVHGTAVHLPDPMNLSGDTEPQADAAVTRLPRVVLAILTADCLPVLFCSRDGSEVAAAHAGWRGLNAGVLEATLAHMQAAPVDVLAWIGPAIGAGSYEVGKDVHDAFVDSDPKTVCAFSPSRPGHWHCDLSAIAYQRLRTAGVASISSADVDTRSDARFYSYRRAALTGRFASLIWRE